MAEIAIAFAVYVALARLSRGDLLGLLRAPKLNSLVISAVNDENEVVMSRLEGMKGFIVPGPGSVKQKNKMLWGSVSRYAIYWAQ